MEDQDSHMANDAILQVGAVIVTMPGVTLEDSVVARAEAVACAKAVTGDQPIEDIVESCVGKGIPLIVLFVPPVEYIAAAISAGLEPSAACVAWEATAQRLHALIRQSRRTVLLLSTKALYEGTAEPLAALAKRLGKDVVPPFHPLELGPLPPISQLVAMLVVQGAPALRRLATELDSACFGDTVLEIDLTQVNTLFADAEALLQQKRTKKQEGGRAAFRVDLATFRRDPTASEVDTMAVRPEDLPSFDANPTSAGYDNAASSNVSHARGAHTVNGRDAAVTHSSNAPKFYFIDADLNDLSDLRDIVDSRESEAIELVNAMGRVNPANLKKARSLEESPIPNGQGSEHYGEAEKYQSINRNIEFGTTSPSLRISLQEWNGVNSFIIFSSDPIQLSHKYSRFLIKLLEVEGTFMIELRGDSIDPAIVTQERSDGEDKHGLFIRVPLVFSDRGAPVIASHENLSSDVIEDIHIALGYGLKQLADSVRSEPYNTSAFVSALLFNMRIDI